MSVRTATMSNSYSTSVRRPGFFRKLVVFMLFVGGITGLIVLVNYYQTRLTPWLMTIFAVLAIGLAAGAGSRTVFYKWSGFVRFIVILFVLPIGFFFLGVFSKWENGIWSLEPW